MNVLTYIEKVYESWDGTDVDAAECMRYIELAVIQSKVIDKVLLKRIK